MWLGANLYLSLKQKVWQKPGVRLFWGKKKKRKKKGKKKAMKTYKAQRQWKGSQC